MSLFFSSNRLGQSKALKIKVPHLFLFMALFSALIGFLYVSADALYTTKLELIQTELASVRQEKAALETKLSELLEKLTRLNALYSLSIKKTTNRVETIASHQSNTAQKIYELQAMNDYLIQESQQLQKQLRQSQKQNLSSSTLLADPHDPMFRENSSVNRQRVRVRTLSFRQSYSAVFPM